MTVSDTETVDTVAQAPDGRYLVIMTEDRYYALSDAALLVEELRRKLNTTVAWLRSGGLRETVGRSASNGVDIELSCRDEPPTQVREMIALAAQGLAAEGIGVRYHLLPPPTMEQVFDQIGRLLIHSAPAGWQRISLTASLVGDGLTGGLTATTDDGASIPMAPPPWLPTALGDLKRALWEPDRGTWLTFRAEVDHKVLTPSFDFDVPPDGAEAFPPRDWAEELRRYPRTTVPAWWRDRLD